MKVLKIIDGNALLFRAYFASSYSGVSLTTSSGIPTNAVYVFANMLQKILFPVDQDVHILVAFDTGEKTFRHQELESYKAHRKPVPEDLIPQFSIARGLLNALNLFTFEQSGFEGDDVAGTAAMLGLKAGMEVEIYTSDRDFLQLVQPHLTVHLIRKGVSEMVKMTREKVIEEYGITPEQVPDYKGLVGDASDNLPGIPGIGDKTAVKLLQQFSTFEKVLEAASTLKGKTAENLITHQQSGILSKKLAMIQTNMNLPFQLEQTLYQGIQQDQFLQFVTQYEMKSLLGRFQTKTKETATELVFEKVRALPDGTYKQISIVPLIKQGNYFQSTLEGWVIHHQSQTYLLSLEDSQHDQVWQRIMQDKEVEKISFDFKELIVLCHRYHIQLDGPFFDCMLATYAIEENPSLNRQAVMQQVGITLSEDLVEQSVQVAQALLPMKNKLVEQLKEKQLEKIVYEIEFPLIPVLASMEIEGIPIDVPYLKNMEKNVAEKIDDLKKQIFSLMGQTFNL
ncbi:MAG: 5'-3' exonuclease H3TH domain-containing protein, partial [Bacilli bacterium]